jgi:hypothetical protein
MDKRLSDLINWLNEREERERIAILVGSCIIISMLWYLFLEKPLILSRLRIHHQIESLQKQTLFFRNEANGILIHTGALKQQEKTNVQENAEFQTLNIHFASPEGNNELVKAILAPAPAKPDATPKPAAAPSKDGYQVIFESDFMNTLAYLKALEKLPWCLSWDSLEYSVMTYPTASVAVTLHIVSA